MDYKIYITPCGQLMASLDDFDTFVVTGVQAWKTSVGNQIHLILI